jgi:hypothetical protein
MFIPFAYSALAKASRLQIEFGVSPEAQAAGMKFA